MLITKISFLVKDKNVGLCLYMVYNFPPYGYFRPYFLFVRPYGINIPLPVFYLAFWPCLLIIPCWTHCAGHQCLKCKFEPRRVCKEFIAFAQFNNSSAFNSRLDSCDKKHFFVFPLNEPVFWRLILNLNINQVANLPLIWTSFLILWM